MTAERGLTGPGRPRHLHRAPPAVAPRADNGHDRGSVPSLRCGVAAVLALLAGCEDDGATPPQSTPTGTTSTAACEPGTLALDGGCLAAGMQANGCPAGEVATGDAAAPCRPAGIPPDACGDGFVPNDVGGCDPVLPSTPCGPGTMALPGDVACAAVAPCALGTWGDIPVGTSQFVDAAFVGVSDGSQSAPWTRIQDAVDAAAPGTTIAVAAGSYPEDVAIAGKPVTLLGRCPELVEIVGSGTGVAAVTIGAGSNGTAVRRLSVTGGAQGLEIRAATGVALDALRIHDTAFRGLYVEVDQGQTSVTMTRSLIEGAHRLGVWISGADFTIEDSVVRDCVPAADGQYGDGIFVEDDAVSGRRARVVVRHCLVERNTKVGVFSAGSDLTVEASLVRDTVVGTDSIGRGVQVQDNPVGGARSKLELIGSVIEGCQTCGLTVYGSDASMEASVIRDTLPGDDQQVGQGRGISVDPSPSNGQRSTLTIRSSLLSGNHEIALQNVSADLDIDATRIRDTRASGAFDLGRGVNVQAGPGGPSKVMMRSCTIEGSHELGIFAGSSDAHIEGVLVRDTQLGGPEHLGIGIVIQSDSAEQPGTATLRSCAIEGTPGVGLAVAGGEVLVEATRIDGTQTDGSGVYGDGVSILRFQRDAVADLRGVRVRDSARVAIASFGGEASLAAAALECNAIQLDGEPYAERQATFHDRGGNVCGCNGAETACVALSSELTPPPLAAAVDP